MKQDVIRVRLTVAAQLAIPAIYCFPDVAVAIAKEVIRA